MADQNRSRPDEKFDYRDIAASNVSGSTAGASSGDFHVYRQQRRRELDRIERMEQEAKERQDTQARIGEEMERKTREETQTKKRAAKRKRKKELRDERKKRKGFQKNVDATDNQTMSKMELKRGDEEVAKSEAKPTE